MFMCIGTLKVPFIAKITTSNGVLVSIMCEDVYCAYLSDVNGNIPRPLSIYTVHQSILDCLPVCFVR